MFENRLRLVPTASINVGRERRQRARIIPEKVEELAKDIAKNDLIQPIVAELESNLLLAGEHRILAFKLLAERQVPCPFPAYKDWTVIPVRYGKNISPAQIEAIELLENLRRVALDWKDEALAVLRFHLLMEGEDPEWSGNKTADALGLTSPTCSRSLTVARAIQANHPKMREASSISTAYNFLQREQDRAIGAELDSLSILNVSPKAGQPDNHPIPPEERVDVPGLPVFNDPASPSSPRTRPHPTPPAPASSVLCANFHEWARDYRGPKFQFLHCDFPYGIGLDKGPGQGTGVWNRYDDSEEVYWALLETLAEVQDILLSRQCHIMFWFSQSKTLRRKTEDFFEENMPSWVVQDFPMIWHKTDNSGILPDPERYGRRTYETALCLTRADRKVVQAVALSYGAPDKKELHRSEKPEAMLRHFFRMFCDSHTRMLDPTCGSATSLRAAKSLGAQVIGLEVDAEMAEQAEVRLKKGGEGK